MQDYLHGQTMRQIAARRNIDTATVCRDIKAARAEWAEHRLLGIDELKANELAKLEAIELAAWQGWDRSCDVAQSKRTKQRGTAAPETDTTERGQAGNPRFLELAIRCHEKRCELLGLKEVRPEDERDAGAPEPGELTLDEFKRLSPQEQIRVMAERFRKWTGARARSKPADLLTGPLPAQGDEGAGGAENAPLA